MVHGERSWHVDELILENFRCFERLHITFEAQLTILVGTNGSGKSAVLDGLAVMLSTITKAFEGDTVGFYAADARRVSHDLGSIASVAHLEAQYPVAGWVRGVIDGSPVEWWRRRERSKGGRTTWAGNEASRLAESVARSARRSTGIEPVLPLLAAYGVERLVLSRSAAGDIGPTRFAAYQAALDPRSDLRRLSNYLRDLTLAVTTASELGDEPATAARAQLDSIERACEIVLDGTGWGSPRWNARLQEITLAHARHGVLPLAWLAAGIRIAAGVAIDLASRAARANPGLGAGGLLARVPGIVLVDEVDLHLHPSWQQRIVAALTTAFPRVQFILTTHSPQVLSTVQGSQIRELDAAVVDRKFQYARGLRPDVVLWRVMGTRPEPDTPERRLLDRYTALVHDGEGDAPEARGLRRRLENELGGPDLVPELAAADAHIAFEDLVDS
jgi:predicted ATP-binding protein involved in virulence